MEIELNKKELKKLYSLVDIAKSKNQAYITDYKGYITLSPTGMYCSDGYRVGRYKGTYFDSNLGIHYVIVQAIKAINPDLVKMDSNGQIEVIKDATKVTTMNVDLKSTYGLKWLDDRIPNYTEYMDIKPSELIAVLEKYDKLGAEAPFVRITVNKKDGYVEAIAVTNDKVVAGPDKVLMAATEPVQISFSTKYLLKYAKMLKKARHIRIYFTTASAFAYAEEVDSKASSAYEFTLAPVAPMI